MRQLDLPDPVFDALTQAAIASGTTPVAWIAAHLSDNQSLVASDRATSMADRFKGRTGRIASGGKEANSEDCGERFTDHLEMQRREGQL